MDHRAQSPSDDDDVPYRRRGRPIGKNRVPLSLNERRARNALYERERRYETAEAMTELAGAANCDSNLSNSDILATVISQLQRAAEIDSSREIEELKRSNEKLLRQVEALERRLSNWEDSQCKHEDDECLTIDYSESKRRSHKGGKSAKILKPRAGSLSNIKNSDSQSLKLSDHDGEDEDEEVEVEVM